MKKPIHVTAPSLCDLGEFSEILQSVWSNRILTHNGPLVKQFENNFKQSFSLNKFLAVTSGTIALQIAIKALKLKGEIITTPFSWIATCSAIQSEGCTPVFADIDPDTFNIDPDKIQEAITENTVAILPVHVFSNPCEIERIQKIADKNNLKVIYDAAHAVGVKFKNRSLLEFGDISATSFHATKILNCGEGGGCVTLDKELFDSMNQIRFFGYNEEKEIVNTGFNGKLTEIHAALGIANLPYLEDVLRKRKFIADVYYKNLSDLKSIKFQKINPQSYNFSYFPIVLDDSHKALHVLDCLQNESIFARRYFYPSLNTIDSVSSYVSMPVSESISERILCLPCHNDLEIKDLEKITQILRKVLS